MDESRFDDLSRLLGDATTRRAGLKAALGALLGGAAGAAALEAEAKRRRDGGRDAEADRKKKRKKKCRPECAAGQRCVKGACVCDNGGTACGADCCAVGQRCEGGQCVSGPDPEPGQCIAAGQPCKATGLECCGGRVCSSGQGGEADVACYVPKTGACQSTVDCVYGMRCQDGRCAPPPPAGGLGTPCDAAAQQLCTTPGAVCTAYTGAGAPGGAFCTLPLQKTCTGNPECTCYKCWYSNATTPAGRRGRASANTMSCCHAPGQGCGSDRDCCLGLSCVNGTCSGTICVPDDQPADMPGCDASTPCCNLAATCTNGTCTTCGPSTCPDGCCQNGVCQPGNVAGACGTGGVACASCTGANGICGGNNTCIQCETDANCASTAPVCVSETCKSCPVDNFTAVATGTSVNDKVYQAQAVQVNNALTGKEVWYSTYGYPNGHAHGGWVGFTNKSGTSVTKSNTYTNASGSTLYLWGLAFSSDNVPFVIAGVENQTTYYLYTADTTTANPGTQKAAWNFGALNAPSQLTIDGDSSTGTVWMTAQTNFVGGGNYARVGRFRLGVDTQPTMAWSEACGTGSLGGMIQSGPGGHLYLACVQLGKVVVLDKAVGNAVTGTPSTQVLATLDAFVGARGLSFDMTNSEMYVSTGDLDTNTGGKALVYRYKITLDGNNVPSSDLLCVYDLSQYEGWPMGTGWDPATGKLWVTSFWPLTGKPSLVGSTTLGDPV